MRTTNDAVTTLHQKFVPNHLTRAMRKNGTTRHRRAHHSMIVGGTVAFGDGRCSNAMVFPSGRAIDRDAPGQMERHRPRQSLHSPARMTVRMGSLAWKRNVTELVSPRDSHRGASMVIGCVGERWVTAFPIQSETAPATATDRPGQR